MKKIMYMLAVLLVGIPATAQAQEEEQAQSATGNPARKNLVIKEWNTDVRSNNKYLDHVTTYNEFGKKVEEIEYNTGGQLWRKRYERGKDGRIQKEYLYDQHNRLVSYKVIEYNEVGKKMQTTYLPNGKVKTIKVYEYSVTNAGE